MNASEMQSWFQFCGSRVLRFSMHNDYVAMPQEDDLSTSPAQSTDVKYEVVSIEKREKYYVGILRLHITTGASSTDGNTEHKNEIGADLWIEGCYVMIDRLSEDDMQKMLIINGSASLYSIARSFISSVTSQSMDSGSLTLPMISTYALYADEKQEAVDTFPNP